MNVEHLPHLSRDFWEKSEKLQEIQRAAFASFVSPDALLACILCRVATSVPPTVLLHGDATFDFVAALVGESGTGKSEAMNAARKLLPNIGTNADGWGLGSGQGIAKAYAGRPEKDGSSSLKNTAVLFSADEGEQLIKLRGQEGSILLATIRSAWNGQPFGQTNADDDRQRNIAARSVRFAMQVGFQPDFAMQLLSGEHAGDPQRFLFASVTHPDIPDDPVRFPEPWFPVVVDDSPRTLVLESEAARFLRGYRAKKARKEVQVDALDSHRYLLQIKVGGLLAVMHGDEEVSAKWWTAAEEVVDVSRAVRARLVARREQQAFAIAEQRGEQDAAKESARRDALESRARESHYKAFQRAVANEGGPVSWAALTQACNGAHRKTYDVASAVKDALREGVLVEVRTDTGKVRYDIPR